MLPFRIMNIKKIKLEEIVIVGIAVGWAYISCTDLAVSLLYNDWFMRLFGELFKFYNSYALLYSGDKRQPMLFFAGLFLLFPYVLFVINKYFKIDCVKVRMRYLDYIALYLIAAPAMLYFEIASLLRPIPENMGFTLQVFINFSLKSKFNMALTFTGGLVLVAVLVLAPYKYLKCLKQNRGGNINDCH